MSLFSQMSSITIHQLHACLQNHMQLATPWACQVFDPACLCSMMTQSLHHHPTQQQTLLLIKKRRTQASLYGGCVYVQLGTISLYNWMYMLLIIMQLKLLPSMCKSYTRHLGHRSAWHKGVVLLLCEQLTTLQTLFQLCVESLANNATTYLPSIIYTHAILWVFGQGPKDRSNNIMSGDFEVVCDVLIFAHDPMQL